MPLPARFGEVLARRLAARRMTQRAFARGVGIPPAFVTKLLAGERGVPTPRIEAWADFLGLLGDERKEFIAAAMFSGIPARHRDWLAGWMAEQVAVPREQRPQLEVQHVRVQAQPPQPQREL